MKLLIYICKKYYNNMLDLEKMNNKLKDLLNSPEGIERVQNFFQKYRDRDDICAKQIDTFRQSVTSDEVFDEFVQKVIKKYSSDKYRDKWYNLNIEPPEQLYFFLYEYAKKYGANFFEYYEIHRWRFERIRGQGCFIEITKLT